MKLYHIISYVFILAFLVGSCTDERESSNFSGKEAMLEWRLDVPGAVNVSTRATSVQNEEALLNVNTLVFDKDDKFAYIATSVVDPAGDGSAKVRVKMKLSLGVADTYRLMFVANTTVDEATLKDKTKEEVQTLITFASSGKWDVASKSIPMWGETEQFEVTANFTTPAVEMMRAMARIDVGLNFTATLNGFEVAGGISGYSLENITLYRSRTSGYVIPAASNLVSGVATDPSIPGTAGTYIEAITYSSAAEVSGDVCVREIYLAENTVNGASSNPVVLVAGIKYDNVVTYYPIELRATNNTTDRLPLLRNHRYIINIKSITGKGYADAETALANKPMNAQWTLVVDDIANNLTHVSGSYFFEIEKVDILLGGTIGSTTKVAYKTNIPSFSTSNLAWVTPDAGGVNFDISSPTMGFITFTTESTNITENPIMHTIRVMPSPIDEFNVTVTQDIGRVKFNFKNLSVHGIYLPKMNLGGTQKSYPLIGGVHYITLDLETNKSDDLQNSTATYTIKSSTVNGYSFAETTGRFNSTSYTDNGAFRYFHVTLPATGTPNSGGYNYFTLTGDGESLDTPGTQPIIENVRVLCGYKAKKMLCYSYYQNMYGYSTNSGGSNAFMKSGSNFGLSGTIPIERVDRSWARVSNVGWTIESGDDFMQALSNYPQPDIVLLGFDFELSASAANSLNEYITNGGVIIMLNDHASGNNHAANNVTRLCRVVTGVGNLGVASVGSAGYTFPLPWCREAGRHRQTPTLSW
ncbi:hypothetical protein [Bacteroides reticulotermitis]|uniref:Uncharacterized protein n=1 Tax=Bacteroides reticulotermitis JCM 10512 TaxID=1445607 RepID=W4UUN2_9BACE|nr:hypothetical protein [Bacteroides reticulotermitis]GAE84229.1 hypothetical protein JCM10512_2558 [Bacteroides reticulotermitis JCM 10512]